MIVTGPMVVASEEVIEGPIEGTSYGTIPVTIDGAICTRPPVAWPIDGLIAWSSGLKDGPE
jgi:hypothetical protein